MLDSSTILNVLGTLLPILRWDVVSISLRALEIFDPRALPYSRSAVSHIGLTKWD
jgi:hypothetical protein